MDDLTESRLQTAYELIKAGQSDKACEILIPLVRANPDLTDGWFLLGHAVNNLQEKIRCFRQVLRLDPANQPAQKQLARLRAAQPASKKKTLFLFWELAGIFICLSGLGLLWGFGKPSFINLAPISPASATPSPVTVTLVVSTSTPDHSPIPKTTSRPTITLYPTLTPQPSVTIIPTVTLTFTKTSAPPPRSKPKNFTGCLAPNGLGSRTAPFKIENFGKDRALVHIKGVSPNGNYPITCQATVKQGLPVIFELMWGKFEYIIFRGGGARRGSFVINQPFKATMRIFKDKIQIGEFP